MYGCTGIERTRGMGMGATGSELATSAVGGAAAVAAANTTAIATTLGVAVPVVGAVLAAVVLGVTAWLNRMGPKQKTWTSQIADQVTAKLKEVKAAYFAAPYNPANQAAAVQAINALLQALRDGCSQTQMGEPGRRCIAERLVRGGSAPWCPTGTGCDYFTEYLDPVVNDARAGQYAAIVATGAQAQVDPATGKLVAVPTIASTTGIPQWALLAAAGVALLFAVKGLE